MSEYNNLFLWNQRINTLALKYLDPQGWFKNMPADSEGYTPWFTYPAISFMKDVISRDMKVFEFGSGYSTLYFNANVDECRSVEHNDEWVATLLGLNATMDIVVRKEAAFPAAGASSLLSGFLGENFELPLSGSRNHNVEHGLLNAEFFDYATELTKQERGYYDIIVVDGMARSFSGYLAANLVADTGYIVLDNSDRWQYNSLQRYLVKHGFGRIDFWGPGPVNAHPWCTSFFSRNFKVNNHKIERPPMSGDLGW